MHAVRGRGLFPLFVPVMTLTLLYENCLAIDLIDQAEDGAIFQDSACGNNGKIRSKNAVESTLFGRKTQ